MAKVIYGELIRYSNVVVHCESYLPFGLQDINTAMAPNGELWFRSEKYERDYSVAPADRMHLFIHEMAHVWQYQKGMWVRSRGIFSWAADYHYTLDDSRKLDDYTMEQQASIVSDYWLIISEGFDTWLYMKSYDVVKFKGVPYRDIATTYEKTLSDYFLERDR